MKMIEIEPKVSISIIKETLERIGIVNNDKHIIYPSCYLFIKDKKFYIIHFKEYFLLCKNNSYNNISEEDILRKNTVIVNLEKWQLINIKNRKDINGITNKLSIIKYKDKQDWTINHKIKL